MVVGLSLFGCQKDAYIPDAKFVDLYVELKLASVVMSQDQDKSSEVRGAIIAQHKMTYQEFHNHFMQLVNHPDAWRGFQEQVVSRIDAFQKKNEGDTRVK